jgi:LysR family cys regulon transcriptional activator
MAFEPERDHDLQAIDVGHLFAASTTSIGLRKNAYLREYLYFFIALFAPKLTLPVVNHALHITENKE